MHMPDDRNSRGSLDATYMRLLEICDGLEAIADGLPHHTDPHFCLDILAQLEPLLEATHLLEEQVLFPTLDAWQLDELKPTIERLRREHVADHAAAQEVIEALESLVLRRPSLSPDAIGYLLRSFFESVRRHVSSERDLLRLFSSAHKKEQLN